MGECTVFLIEDEELVAAQLSDLLSSQGWQVRAFRTVREFEVPTERSGPACLVLEAVQPDGQGPAVQRQLAEAGADLPMVFIARRADVREAVEVMRCGACDFLLKPLRHDEMLNAVQRALQHDHESMNRRAQLNELRRRENQLTARERAVLAGVVHGKLNKQVAAELAVAEGTVKVYRRRLMQKMGAVSLADLVRMVDRLESATRCCQ